MKSGTIAAVILAALALIFIIYSGMFTPRMNSGVPEQGYRPPIQDQKATEPKQPPLQDTNVPPAGPQNR